jgi:AraC family transcriptional regulator
MDQRPLTFADPGQFEVYCHHSGPTLHTEEMRGTLQICVPLEGARYSVVRHSETGRAITQHLGARDILVIPTGQPHAIDWRRPADIVSLQLTESFVAHALGVPRLPVRDTFTVRDPFISAAARQLRMALAADRHMSPAFAAAIATAITFRVASAAPSGPQVRSPESAPALRMHQLALVEQYVDEHLGEPVTLAALANLLGLSQWHFMRCFKSSHGLSAHEFVTQRRLARAQALLMRSELSITDVALEVGMSHSHFSRTFLRRCGVSPREYRRGRS